MNVYISFIIGCILTPVFRVSQTNSLSSSSVNDECSLCTFCNQTSTSWLASPWRGPANPFIEAAYER